MYVIISINPEAYYHAINLMRGPRKFCQGMTFIVFLVDKGGGVKYHYKRAIIGSPAKRHFAGVAMMAQH